MTAVLVDTVGPVRVEVAVIADIVGTDPGSPSWNTEIL
jgi:hypothetical protein